MARLESREIENKQVWEKFILSRNPKSFLQSWNWGETNRIVGKRIFRIGIYQDGNLVGAFLAIKEAAKRGPHLLIPGGPIIDWQDDEVVSYTIIKIRELGKDENVWFVRLRPEIKTNQEALDFFKKMGSLPAPIHLHAENTWILDITKSDDELLAGMRKSTRYLIKKSLNIGLTFETTTDLEKARYLTNLQKETVARHGFVGFSNSLFKAQLATFGKDREGTLYLCKKGREVLAAAIIIFYGSSAYYHHSASTSKYRDLPFSYFLQWNIIADAKKRGKNFYNFWGVAPTDDPKHRFAGVTLFKKGFGGTQIDWLHAQDFPLSPFYIGTRLFETLRKTSRRL